MKAHKPISKPIVVTGIASTVVIGTGAFVLSFSALTDLAVRAGITPEIGWMWPLIVDGMIVAATVAIVALAGREGKEQFYPWILLFFGAVVSTAANAIHAILAVKASNGNVPVLVSALVAAMPPVVLLAITHLTVLLVQYARNSAEIEAALVAAEEAERAQAALAADPAPAADGADAAPGSVAVVESVLAETAQTAAAPSTPAELATPSEAPVVGAPASSKPKAAPKRKPRKPATAAPAGAPVSKPAVASQPATTSKPAASAAKPAVRPAAKSTGSTRQLMPELSTVTGVNPLLRAPQTAAPAAETAATTTTASSAEAVTALEAPGGPSEAAAQGNEESPKELVSAQA